MTRAHLDKRPDEVAAMFDRTAERYDLVNDVLSAGQDRLWRRAVARTLRPYTAPGRSVLDIAAGTGTSARAFAADGARCVACDFSLGMLRVGARRLAASSSGAASGAASGSASAASSRASSAASSDGPAPAQPAHGGVSFVGGDALALPFRDCSFDAVTVSFGLRNVADPGAALAEMLRVTRPGGGLVICEFSHLPFRSAEALYRRYLDTVLPVVARRVSSNPDAYEYLAESIIGWPDQEGLARRIRAAGWSSVRWRNLSLGVVALHVGQRSRGGSPVAAGEV